MIEYIKGRITERNPAYLVIETNAGTGYFISISLNTYSLLDGVVDVTLPVHEVIREDAHQLYGFADRGERELFRLLISVNGVGPNTARMMLSSLKPAEIERAISESNVNLLKSIKGIGMKTAERIIVDLRDKTGKVAAAAGILPSRDNTMREEALSALMMLGFVRSASLKVIEKLLAENENLTVEELIKQALRNL
ncbi:MAG: Holliday junction branch migration protein RuvA [Bacteroidales bacterium]|jgi:Holliday junction DNA helicase RuvA|nr:Holliday junction branch migration protein RuvA [Bacteroidales bacterium]